VKGQRLGALGAALAVSVAWPLAMARPAADEAKGPRARYRAAEDSVVLDARADQKRDEQIGLLQKLVQRSAGEEKAESLFQLAELWWEKSRFAAHRGIARYDEAFRTWALRKQRGEDPGAEPRFEAYARDGEVFRQEALRTYEEILKAYPGYARRDEVLFAFAFNLDDLGRKDQAARGYAELIERYPKSKFLGDAYVQLGEHYFAANQLEKARGAYQKALSSNSPKIRFFALYKLAWCDYNAGAYADAVQKFEEVIAGAGPQKGSTGLRAEALNDIVQSFAQLNQVDEALAYFRANADAAQARQLGARLAVQLSEAGRHESAVRLLRRLIEEAPLDARCPELQATLAESYERLGRRDKVAEEMSRFAERYGPQSAWAKANRSDPAALERAREAAESILRRLATEYHQEAQKTRRVETYRLARDLYREYLGGFGDSEHTYELRYFYAEILWALDDLEVAAQQYLKVVAADKAGQYSKLAAYDAVLCYERLAQMQRRGEKAPEIHEGQKIGEKKKGKAQRVAVRLQARDRDAREEPLSPFEDELIRAIDLCVGTYPGIEDEIALRYKAAFVLYDHNQDVEAARRFGAIIAAWPADPWSRKAAELTLNILETREEWLELNRRAREFKANAKLVAGDREFGAHIEDLVEASQYKYIDETIYKAQKDPAQAAEKFGEFVAEFPRSRYAPQALLYAMLIHAEAGKVDRAIESGERLLSGYPEGKAVDGKDLVGRALLAMVSLREKVADFESAARAAERYAERALAKAKAAQGKGQPAAPEDSAADALYSAAVWSEALGNLDRAAALYRRCLELRGRKELPRSEISLKLAAVAAKAGRWAQAARLFGAYAERYGREVGPAKVLLARYRQMLALRDLGDEKGALEKAADVAWAFDKLPPAEREGDAVVQAYAHARFFLLEPQWRSFVALRLNDVARFGRDYPAKVRAIGDLEKGTGILGAYAKVLKIGAADWGIAAATRIGMAYQDFAKNLLESPDPKGLDEEQLALYRGELESRAFPLEEKAAAALESAIAAGAQKRVYGEWVLKAQEALNALKPGAFLEVHEVPLQGAEPFVSAGLATEPPAAHAPRPTSEADR
jgi:tetratricopeptide (TPR) repeat protein